MSSTAIHIVHRNPTAKRRQRLPEAQRSAPCILVRPDRQPDSEEVELRLSSTPLSDPIEIFRRLPAQAIRPALLELLDVMSSPILLLENSPAGDVREVPAARPAVALAA